MLDLTVAIPIKNEAKNLGLCLDAVGHNFAKRVVVIDSSSDDGSQEIAKERNVEVINFQWDGNFPKKRNWFLRNGNLDTKWVLFLDADEFVSAAFREEVGDAIRETEKVGYWLNYTIYYLGKPLKGGYPLKKLALFRVDAGEYERIEEASWSHLDMEIHEHPVLSGPSGEIKSRIDHRDLRGVESWVKKHTEYANWEARRFLETVRSGEGKKSWTLKQRIKYWMMGSPYLPVVFFLGGYFLMGGFLDGRRGLAWAVLKAGYFAQVYSRIVELKQSK